MGSMEAQEDVYCTLVITDGYLPGAAVLAHSLRDAGTKKKLACLIAVDALRSSTINELKSLFDYVLPTDRIPTPNPAPLFLMQRPDLVFTFTKINLWRQTQFRRIVYLDSDVVALRAPDELFDIDLPSCGLAAAPDVGWPDIFNTGVMVLTPNMGEYQALKTQASSGDSFDGADQGLLNQAFERRDWKRLSFTYNVTPSGSYQYEPAYRYFKRDVTLVHFIGDQKPWQKGRDELGGSGSYRELLGRWWSVYDRHFGVYPQEYANTGLRFPLTGPNMNPVEAEVKRQEHGRSADPLSATGYPIEGTSAAPPPGAPDSSSEVPFTEPGEPAENIGQGLTGPTPTAEQRRFSAPFMDWDATRNAPPSQSKPEAANFPSQQYEFNTNPEPFQPPRSYAEPPKDMWYKVPEEPPKLKEKPKPIFPWEEREMPKPTRRFIEDEQPPSPPPKEESPPERSFGGDEFSVEDDKNVNAGAVTPNIQLNDDTPWQSGFAKNAWDDVNGIDEYVRALTSFQRNRGNVQVLEHQPVAPGNTPAPSSAQQHILSPTNEPNPEDLEQIVAKRRESLILTDFPTAVERPSLPVTPAPRRRSTFWGEERDNQGNLPAAEGVPDQADWDPNAQLEQLRRSSLIGPSDLQMPRKIIPQRKMPLSAAPIPEHSVDNSSSPLRSPPVQTSVPAPGPETSGVPSGKASNALKSAPAFSEPGFGAPSSGSEQQKADRNAVLSPTEEVAP